MDDVHETKKAARLEPSAQEPPRLDPTIGRVGNHGAAAYSGFLVKAPVL